MLIDDSGRVVHANPAAHVDLCNDHPLHLVNGQLRAQDPRDASVLLSAVGGAARRGLRRLIGLHTPTDERINVSVAPLCGYETGTPSAGQPLPRHPVLVMLGKRRIGGQLAIEAFARLHRLSSGETRVLPCCAVIGRRTLWRHIAEHPEFAFDLLRRVIALARMATASARSMALLDVHPRLVQLLDSLASPRDDGSRVVADRLTHGEIASRVGCSREMISRLMKDLVRGAYLRIDPGRQLVLLRPLPGNW